MAGKQFKFFKELKSRKVYRVATVYAITGWIIIEVVVATFPFLHLPDWLITAVIVSVLIGFPVALLMAWAFEFSPEGIVRTSSPEAENNPLPANKRKPFTGTITIIVLIVLLAGQFIYFSFIRDPGSKTDNTSLASQLPQNSIAVLPFKNMSEDKDNLYFSDGVMEAILNNLSRIKDLKVVSRTSVERYRDDIKPIPQIASELEVANILEGSVQKIGNNVRITVQLISADNDEHIWATHYDRDISDIFVVQSEIARTIAENLKVILTAEERELIENAPTTNLKAYDLFLKAKDQNIETKKDIEKVIGMYKDVISMDKNFGLAYDNLGAVLYKLNRFGEPNSIWVDSAIAMIDKSLQLDPTNANAYRHKSYIYKTLNDEEKVKENLLKALQYDPNNFFNLKYLGLYYLRIGEYDRGIDYMLKSLALNKPDEKEELYDQMGKIFENIDRKMLKRFYIKALESDPESRYIAEDLTKLEICDKNYEAALQYALKVEAVDFERNWTFPIAYCYMLNKQYDKSDQYFTKLKIIEEKENEAQGQSGSIYYQAYVKIMLGNSEEGQVLMKAYKDTLFQNITPDLNLKIGVRSCFDIARVYAWEKNKNEAMAWLEKIVGNGPNWYSATNLLFLNSDPFFNNLREDDGFKKVVQSFLNEEESRRQLLREKLAEYHDRNELKWIKLD